MNLFESAPATTATGALGFNFGGETLPLSDQFAKRFEAGGLTPADKLIIGFRPEAFSASDRTGEAHRLQVRVIAVEAMGHEQILYFDAGVPPLRSGMIEATVPGSISEAPSLHESAFAARLPSRCRAVPGESMSLTLDLGQAHVFDAKGNALDEHGADPTAP